MKKFTTLYKALKSSALKILLVFSILFGGGNTVVFAASTTVTYNGGIVCAGGALALNLVLANTSPTSIPPGHRTNGVWKAISPANIAISSLTDPNAVITSGLVVGPNVITWTHQTGKVYTININVINTFTPAALALTADTKTDLVLCAAKSVVYQSSAGFSSYKYWIPSISTSFIAGGASYTTTGGYFPTNELAYVTATDGNGCQSVSNTVKVSNTVTLSIQGNSSACDLGVVGKVLEVKPYDNTFTYLWTRPVGSVGATNLATYTIDVPGSYSVQATKGGCPVISSNVVTVSLTGLIKPSITAPSSTICGTAPAPILLTSGNAAPLTNLYWYKDGTIDASANNALTYTAPQAGSYTITRKEIGNELCYSTSDPYVITPVVVDQAITFTQVCNTATINWSFTGGTPNYTVAILPGIVGPFTVNSGSSTSFPFAATTAFSVASVVDATGCASDPLNFSAPTTLTYYSTPTVQTVTGTNVCTPTGLIIGLSNSEIGVTYSLYEVSNPIALEAITPLATGAFNFTVTPSIVGAYKVTAKRGACTAEIDMTGTLQVTAQPTLYNMTGPAGSLCSSSTSTFGLDGSTAGVTYRLVRLPNITVASYTSVIGGAFSFLATQSVVGTYKVTADNGSCAARDMTGNFTINQVPTQFNVTGNGAVGSAGCSSTGLTIALDGNEAGVFYTLYKDGISLVSQTGNSNFGFRNSAGTYTIVGILNGCTTVMNGQATIYSQPLNQTFTTTGFICPSGTVAINNSESNVSYQVFYQANALAVETPLPGTVNGVTGFPKTLGGFSTPGIYSVRATTLSGGCTTILSDRLTIQASPSLQTLMVNKNPALYCSTAGLSGINLSINTELNVNYQLYKNLVAEGPWISGTGGVLTPWSNVTAGDYTVRAFNTGGCVVNMTGTIQVASSLPPSASISVQAPSSKCAGGPETFTLNVTLTGTAPFNFKIVDGVGNVIRNVVGGISAVHSEVVVPVSTTTYRVIDLVDAVSCSPLAGIGTATVTVNPIPIITISSVPNGFQTCSGSPITVTADGAGLLGIYEWSLGAAALGNNPSITVSPSVNTTYQVKATTAQGCFASANVPITVHSLPLVDFTAPNYVYCQNNPDVTLTGNPAGGAYTGLGMVAAGSNLFRPSIANPGNLVPVNTPITYTLTDGFGCTNSISKSIVVNPTPIVAITGLQGTYCANAGVINFNVSPALNPNPTGFITVDGQLAGKNVWWFDDNDGTGRLDVGAALANVGEGTYNFRYTYTTPGVNGCTSTLVRTITINPNFNTTLSMAGFPINPCQTDAFAYPLTASAGSPLIAANIVFTGPGITNIGTNWFFTPSVAGNGTHTITLSYTDATGCTGSITSLVTVGTTITVNGLKNIYCKTDPSLTIVGTVGGVSPGGGQVELWSGTVLVPGVLIATDPNDANAGDGSVVFTPAAATVGDYFIKYTYSIVGCTNIRTFEFELVDTPVATFTTKIGAITGITNFCQSVTDVDLVPTTAGGNFIGPGVTGLKFNPSAAGDGTHTIRYTVTTTTCSAFYDMDVTVNALPTYSITIMNAQYCDNVLNSIIEINGAVAGTPRINSIFSSTNNGLPAFLPFLKTDFGDGRAEIQPSSVGAGSYTVSFSDKNTITGCSNTYSQVATVVKSDPVNVGGFNPTFKYCKDDAPFNITASFVVGGVLVGGTYAPSDNTDAVWLSSVANTGVATIDPSKASVGMHSIIFSYVNPNGCATSVSKSFEILDNPTKFNVLGGGNYCAVLGTGLTVSLSGSQVSPDIYEYELFLNGAPLATPRKEIGTGGVIIFGDNIPVADVPLTITGAYTIVATNKASGCQSLMTGSAVILINAPDITSVITPVSCKGVSDGQIVITVTPPAPGWGSSPPYQYSILNGAVGSWSASNTFVGLPAAATYKLIVKDALGCSMVTAKNATITEPALALTVSNSISPKVGCNIAPYEGGTTLTITGGTPFAVAGYPDGYDIKWYDASNTLLPLFNNKKTISGLNVGTYRADVKDAATPTGCTATVSFTVDAQPTLNIAIDPDITKHIDNNCSGGFAGEFAVIASGGSGSYQFSRDGVSWFPAGGTPAIVFPATQSYTFTGLDGIVAGKAYVGQVRDFASQRCTASTASVSIFSPAPLTLSGVKTDISCNNAANGVITLTAGGGKSGTYNYKLNAVSPFQGATNVYSPLAAGTYTVLVQDAAFVMCSAVAAAPITLSNPLTISATALLTSNVDCFGASTGAVTAIASGGTGLLSYRWYNILTPLVTVSNTVSAAGLIAGTYIVEVKDAMNCVKLSNSIVVTEPALLNALFNPVTPASCAGDGGSATIQISGGTAPYIQTTWSPIGGAGVTAVNLPAGAYAVAVKDSKGCIINPSVNIGSLAPNVVAEDVSAGQHIDVLCNGSATGSFTVVGSGGSGLYDFSIDNKVTWQLGNAAFKYVYSAKLAGSYTVWVRDRNHPTCMNVIASPIVISQPLALGLSVVAPTPVAATCNGVSDGIITVQGSGGSGAFNYSLDGGAYGLANSWGTLSAGSHSVWVSDANAPTCQYKGMAGVVVGQTNPINFIYSKINPTCNGLLDGSITVTVSAGSGSVSSVYAYSKDNGATYQASNTFSGLSGGIYDIRVRDITSLSLCQSASTAVTITTPAALSATEVLVNHVNVKCFGAATGAFRVAPVPVSASLEYSINGGATWQLSPDFSGLTAGSYTVSVRNSVAPTCTTVTPLSITVTGPASPLAITNPVITDVTCNGLSNGSVGVTVTGGTGAYTYTWRNSVNTPVGLSTPIISGLVADTYSVSVLDANLCPVISVAPHYVVNQPAAWNITYLPVIKNVSTFGGSDGEVIISNIVGAPGPYTITWSDLGGANLAHRTDLKAGVNQSFTITSPAPNSCSATRFFTITQPLQLVATETHTAAKCYQESSGVVNVIVSSGLAPYTYSYTANLLHGGTKNDGPTTQVSQNISWTSLPAGDYTVTVKDASNQTVVLPIITISEPLEFNIQQGILKDISCPSGSDGQVQLLIGGSRLAAVTDLYAMTWSGPNGFVKSGTVAAIRTQAGLDHSGTYVATVTDPVGCVQSASYSITKPAYWNIVTGLPTNVTTNGGSDGKFSLTSIIGSVAPYQIRWYNAANVLEPAGNDLMARIDLKAGAQSVKVISASTLCDTTINFSITQPGPLTVAASKTDVTCYSGLNGSILINVTSGQPNYTYHIVGNTNHSGAYTPANITQASGTLLYSGLEAGIYDITVTDNVGQTFITQLTLTEPLQFQLVADIVNIQNITCFGQNNGKVGVSIISGIAPAITNGYSLTWTGPNGFLRNGTVGAQKVQSSLVSPGTYIAHVADLNGCVVSDVAIPITEPSAWNVSDLVTPVSTYGGTNGAINVNSVAGNTAPYTIAWADAPSVNFLRTGLSANGTVVAPFANYTYTITDFVGCTYSKNVVVVQPLELKVVVTPSPVSCYAGQDGSLKLEITSGNAPYKIVYSGTMWDGTTLLPVTINNAPTTQLISNLKAGTYIIDITDNVGNLVHPPVLLNTITQPNELLMSAVINDVSCYQSIDGQIAVSFAGRPAATYNSYKMEWIGPDPSFYISPATNTILSASTQSGLQFKGNYVVNVWDTNNCLTSQTFPLDKPNKLVVTQTLTNSVTCFGGNDGAITVNVSGRTAGTVYTYSWTSTDPLFVSSNSPSVTNLRAGDYIVTATAPDLCNVISSPITITQNPQLSEITTPVDIITCSGDTTGRLNIVVSGGKSNYTLNIGSGVPSTGAFAITGLTAGSYNYTITDAVGCQLIVTNKVITAPTPLVVSNIVQNADCNLPSSGTLTFNVLGGRNIAGFNQYNITLTSIDGSYSLAQTLTVPIGGYAASFNSLPKGHYTLDVVDNYAVVSVNCTRFSYSFLLENILLTGLPTDATCAGVNNGAITGVTISGASAARTYLWTTLDGSGLDNSTLNQSGLSAGTYTLTVTDPGRGGCVVTKNYVIKYSKALVIDGAVKDLTCYNSADGAIGSINVPSATAPLTYAWTGPSITVFNATASSLTGLTAGDYKLDFKDGAGCSAIRTFKVERDSAITYTLTNTLDNCSPYARSITMSLLTGGAGVGPVPNYSFSWSGPQSGLTSLPDQHNLNVGGTYIVTVKDENLCTVSKSITITGPMKVVESATQLACNGDANGAIGITLSGGTGAFAYSWTSPVVGFVDPATKDLSGLKAGNYHLNIRDNGEIDIFPPVANCILDTLFTISAPDSIDIQYSKSNLICSGMNEGAIHLTIVGGTAPYTVVWSSGNGAILTPGALDQDSLPAGTYTVQVTDFKGCTKSSFITLTQPAPLAFTLTPTDTQCDGTNGSLAVTAPSGGMLPNNYDYKWGGPSITPANQGNPTAINLSGGVYSVTLVDMNSGGHKCSLTKTDTLTSVITLSYSSNSESCQGEFNGAIDITVNGGSGNYSYLWTPSNGGIVAPSTATSQDLGGLPAGTYTVVVTDLKPSRASCSVTQIINIARNHTLNISSQIKNVLCFGANNGAITLGVNGGSGNYTYTWSGPAGFTTKADSIYNCKAGNYTAIIKDVTFGCTVVQNYLVAGPVAPLSISVVDSTNVLCNGSATGIIHIAAAGGTQFIAPPALTTYKYQWAGPGNVTQDSPTQTGLLAGVYQVTVVDANGCTLSNNNIKLTEPPVKLKVTLGSIVHVAAFAGNTGEITVNVVGGANGYNIVWSGTDYQAIPVIVPHPPLVDNQAHQSGLQSGHYNVVVTDGNLCTSSLSSIFINHPGGALTLTTTKKDILPCSGSASGEFTADVNGGMPPYSIKWYKGGLFMGVNGAGGESSLSIGSLTADTYRVDVIDANGNFKTNTISISEPPLLVLNASVLQQIVCYQGQTGTLRINVSGGTPKGLNYRLQVWGPSFSYDQSTILASTNVDIPNLAVGKYHILLTDDSNGDGAFNNNDCSKISDLEIFEPKASVVLSDNSSICAGSSGVIKLITSNWTFPTPLTVKLSDGSTQVVTTSPALISVTPVVTTTYAITSVDNGAGCNKGVFSGSATVTVNALPTGNIHNDATLCLGDFAPIVVDFTGKAPFTYTYKESASATFTTVSGLNGFADTINASPTSITTYTLVSVVDGNCSSVAPSTQLTGSAIISVNPLPTATVSGNAVICEGKSTNLTFAIAGGTSQWEMVYSVTDALGSITISKTVAASPFILSVSPTRTTTYKLISVKDSKGCAQPIGSQQVVVTVNPKPALVGVISGVASVCQGARSVAYTINPVANALSYIWSVPAGDTIVSGQGTTSILVNYPISALDGTITVKAKNLCDSSQNQLFVNVTQLPVAPATPSGPLSSCQGSKGLFYSVAPVVGATSYVWHLPAGYIISGSATGSSILVDLNPTVDVMNGFISVSAVNGCGTGVVSPKLAVAITATPKAIAGIDVQLCGNATSLNATVVGGVNGTWEILSGSGVIPAGSFGNPIASVTNLSQGENKFKWTVASVAGCSVMDTVSIFNNKVTVSASSNLGTTCDGAVTLTGTPLITNITTGQWSVFAGFGTIVNGTSANAGVNGLKDGSNTLRWTITKNTCNSTADVVVINDKPDVPIIVGSNQDRCVTTATLAANVPATGQGSGVWSLAVGQGVIDNVNNATVNITQLGRGDNIFHYTITKNSCALQDEITVRNNILVVNAGVDESVCDGTATLTGTPIPVTPAGITGFWSISPAGSQSFANSSSNSTTVSNLAPDVNTIRWTINQRGCLSTDSILITNNQPTKAVVGSVVSVCGDVATLNGNVPALGSLGSWQVLSGSGSFDDRFLSTSVVRNLKIGENIMRWTISKGACKSSADLKVFNLKVTVDAGKDTSICERTTYLKGSAVPTGYKGLWSIVSGAATFDPDHSPTARIGGLLYDDNVFAWTVTSDTNGCSSVDSVRITVNAPKPANAGSDPGIMATSYQMKAIPVEAGFGTGRWRLLSGGGDIVNVLDATSWVNNLRAGPNVFEWRVNKLGCESSDEVTVTNGAVIQAVAGPNQTICTSTTTLRANDPDVGLGSWVVKSGEGKIDSPGKNETTVHDIGPGRNVFLWTIFYGVSSSSDSVAITNDQPTTPNAGNDRVVCDNIFTLEGNRADVGMVSTWSVVSGKALFDNANLETTVARNLSQGVNVLKYEIKKNTCIFSDTVKITNNLPTKALAGFDEKICTDSIELRPNTPTYGVGEWRIIQGTAFFQGNFAKKLGPNVNILEFRISNGSCISSDSILVTNNTPSVSNAGNDRIVCVDTVTLSANKPTDNSIGKWELLAGAGTIALADVSNPYAKVTALGAGRNRFRWVISKDVCQSTNDVEIANNFIQANAGINNTICTDTLVLDANNPAPGVGSWGVVGGSGGAQFNKVTLPNTVVKNLDRGVNLITWTITNSGCPSVDTLKVTNNSPTTANAGPNVAVCDSFVVLSGNTPSVYTSKLWTVVNGSGNFNDPLLPKASVKGLLFGKNMFRWTIENNGCSSYDDVEVAFNTVYASVGANQVLCSNSATLEASSPLPGIGTWSVVGGTSQATFANSNIANTVVSNLGKGKNILQWSVANLGCVTNATVFITNDLPGDAYAGNTQEICKDNTTLDATMISPGTGYWQILTGSGLIADSTNAKSSVSSLAQGDNVFQWTAVNNLCKLTDRVLIKNFTPSTPYAGADFSTCADSTVLKAMPAQYGTGSWSIVSGAGSIKSPSSPQSDVFKLNPDVNVFKWSVVWGNCRLEDLVEVNNSTPSKANAGPDILDCKDYATLDGNLPTQGSSAVWTTVSGNGEFASTVDAKTKITKLGFGTNALKWTMSKGSCFSSDEVIVFNKVPDQAKAGIDQVVCENYTTLNSNDPTSGVGSWLVMSGLGNFVDKTSFQSKVENIGFGENKYLWTIRYGSCTTSDTVRVLSNKAYADAGADNVTYDGTYNLAANKEDNTPGSWVVVAGLGNFADANNFNTEVTGLRSGVNTFRWTITVDNCTAFDDVSITNRVMPNAAFIADVKDGCSPLTVNFTNYTVGRDTIFSWVFDDGETSTVRHPSHTFVNPGTYNVTLTAKGPDGHDATSLQIIMVRPHPIADFSASPELVYVPGDQVHFYNFSTDAVSYMWYFGYENNISTDRNPIYEYGKIGVYSVALAVKNIYGCSDSIYKADFITAKQQGFIVCPNAFTPRGDSNGVGGGISSTTENSVFKPISKFVDTYDMQIFNQWGQLIFSTTNLDEGWNGEYKGQIVTQGVYVWKITGKFISGKEFHEVGSVMVIR